VAERHPERVREIMADGHEIGHHGYTHTSPANLDAAAEEDELVRALAVLRGFGADVVGYRSPSWDFSPHTLDLLERHGFAYSTNMMDDIRPYRHPGKHLAELPVQWILDDAAHFWFDGLESWTRRISTPSEVREIWEAEFAGIRDLGGAFVLTMHPQVIGRPGRLPLLEGFIEHVRRHDDVWVATCRELAERVP
jgi:peptidoglycan/xylan/chitin deacetylase (PgdA/CDA1 family)